jgi:tetratricopeptide (TPR) repeat protein
MDAETAELLARAAALRKSGRVDEAIAAYEAVLEREPDLPDSWYNLGWLQRRARLFEAALDSYAEALKRDVRDPEEVRLNRAVILADDLMRPKEARAELQAALDMRPDYLPALLNLGNLHEDLGDRAAAEGAYRRALAGAPGHPLALSRLAGVIDARSDADANIAAQIRAALARSMDAEERADLGFALGKLLDARGGYPEAFEAYEAANRASRDSFGAAGRYDRAAHERFVERLIAAFAEPVQPTGEAAPALFVVGMFRSGSTLVERILAGHGRLQSGGELDLVPALVSRIGGYPESVAAADHAQIREWRRFYVDGIAPIAEAGATIIDKRPDNFLHVGLIKTLFPAARIVHTRRNRLDNLLSLYFLQLGPGMPYALDLADAAHWHGQYERLMAHWKTLYPDDIFDVDYDELVREPRPLLERLTGFLGLEWEERMLDFHARSGTVKTASVWQVREPLHARSSGRWRNYEKQLERALGSLEET